MSLPSINSHLILRNEDDGRKLAKALKKYIKSKEVSTDIVCLYKEGEWKLFIEGFTWQLMDVLRGLGIAAFPSGELVFARVDRLPPQVLKSAGFNLLHLQATETKKTDHYFTMADGTLKTVRKTFKEMYPAADVAVDIDIII